MRAHYLQHVPFERPGVIKDWLVGNNHVLTRTKLFRDPEFPDPDNVDCLIVLGGPMGANDESDFPWLSKEKGFIEQVLQRDVPVIGICLGAQLIASVLGADVYPAKYDEIGWYPIELTSDAQDYPMFRGWPDGLDVFHWHGDTFDVPSEAVRIATSQACENQAFLYRDNVIGLQFHVEMNQEDIEYMLEFAGDHDKRGPYVQETEEILSDLPQANRCNALLGETLDSLLEDETVESVTRTTE